MLINCPKCGFSQPKDRYCAKCGIDMDVFQPPSPSALKTLLGNPALQIAFLAAIVAASYGYIKQKEAREIEKRIEFLAGGPETPAQPATEATTLDAAGTTSPPPTEVANANTAELSADTIAPEGQATASPSDLEGAPETAAAAFAARSAPSENPGTLTKSAEVPPPVSVMYAEVSAALIQKLEEEASARGQIESFGEVNYGLIPDIKARLRTPEANSNIKVIQSVRKVFTGLKSPLQWFLGSEENGQRIGFTTSISMTEMSETDLRGEVEIQRSMKEGPDLQAPPVRRSFPANLEIPKGAGVFMTGLLPSKDNLTVLEIDMYSKSILRIMTSEPFKKHETEFVIFFEFDRE